MRVIIAEGTVVTPITVMQTPSAAESSRARTTAVRACAWCRLDQLRPSPLSFAAANKRAIDANTARRLVDDLIAVAISGARRIGS
jgi:hypothetical protein